MTLAPNQSITSNSISALASDSQPSHYESFKRRSETERAIRRMEPVLAFLQNNFHRNPRLEEIAARVRLSPSRVSHLFKSAFAISIGQYLKRLKLQCASRLLEDESLTVKEVMARSDFSDQSHFTNDFKKATGLRPLEYRETRLGNGDCKNDLPGAAGSAKR